MTFKASTQELRVGATCLCVQDREANGSGQVDPRLQERNDLGTATRCRHHQHILSGMSISMKTAILKTSRSFGDTQGRQCCKWSPINSGSASQWLARCKRARSSVDCAAQLALQQLVNGILLYTSSDSDLRAIAQSPAAGSSGRRCRDDKHGCTGKQPFHRRMSRCHQSRACAVHTVLQYVITCGATRGRQKGKGTLHLSFGCRPDAGGAQSRALVSRRMV